VGEYVICSIESLLRNIDKYGITKPLPMTDIDKILQAIAKLTQKVDQQGKVLAGLTATVGTILEEQQAQRIDIRSLHEELHATKEELKSEILSSRAEAKRNTIDLKATLGRKIKGHDQRIDVLEDEASIPHPDEN
jgi:regulator of replication initiation timing